MWSIGRALQGWARFDLYRAVFGFIGFLVKGYIRGIRVSELRVGFRALRVWG